jgi:oligogalacturonide transport system permease protein
MVGEKKWLPYTLLLPWGLGFLLFKLYPFISSFVLSLTDRQKNYIGLANFAKIFDGATYYGALFLNSLKVTFVYVFVTVPLILIVSLLVAWILSRRMKGIGLYRVAFYIPTLLGANVAVLILWRQLFETNDGLVNQFLGLFGVSPVNWFGTSSGAMAVLVLLRVWQFGSTMLIFLSALKNVPETLYEAATIDGASKTRQFFSITLPMITPIILFNGIMRLVDTFQVFNGPQLITAGGPENATHVINLLIYEVAFQNRNLNLGSAMSTVLFLIITVFTVAVFRSSRYWVYYQD